MAHPIVSRQHNYWRITGRQLLGFLKPCLHQWDFLEKTCALGWQVIRWKYGSSYFISDTHSGSGMTVKYCFKSLVCILGIIFVLLSLLFKSNSFKIVYWALREFFYCFENYCFLHLSYSFPTGNSSSSSWSTTSYFFISCWITSWIRILYLWLQECSYFSNLFYWLWCSATVITYKELLM